MQQYKLFENWLNKHLISEISPEVIAMNFNLYEASRGEDAFDIQLIGAPEYNPNNPDWACNVIFSTGEDLCPLKADDWEDCLQIVIEYIKRYLIDGRYTCKIKNLLAITVGFVDGDLEVVLEK